jgi:uncharacterized iron-regulated membrane protein
MAPMLVAALTGTWLVFRVELDRLVNPQLRTVPPAEGRVSLTSIVERVERRFPHAQLQALILPERSDDSIAIYLRSTDATELEWDQVFVNPHDGAILGGRSTSRLVFAREYVDPIVDRLHYSLLMNGAGLYFMGIVAAVWLGTGIVGLALAWPRAWYRFAGWIPVLRTRFSRGTYQANYRSHRAIGVWMLPVLTLLAFTSLYQNLPQLVRPVVNVFSPLAERPTGRPVLPGQPIVDPDTAVANLARQVPGARATSIGRDLLNGRYTIVFHTPGDLSPQGDNRAFVDLTSGAVVALRMPAASSSGDRFLAWIFPLHTGTAFGWPGRVVIALAGVSLVALIASGFYVWGSKWRMRRRAQARSLSETAHGQPSPGRYRTQRGVMPR